MLLQNNPDGSQPGVAQAGADTLWVSGTLFGALGPVGGESLAPSFPFTYSMTHPTPAVHISIPSGQRSLCASCLIDTLNAPYKCPRHLRVSAVHLSM